MCKADINEVMDVSHEEPESLLLKCPKCGSRLRPLLLDMYEERGENFQKIWWTCRNLKNKTCIFPLNMPPEVFWTKRTEDQIRHNVIPLPNYNLLPDELKYLYPFLTNKKILVIDECSIASDLFDIQVSKPRSSSKTTSKGNGTNSLAEKAAVPNNDDMISRPEPAKTPEDKVLENISSPQNKEENFEELKEREKERKSRKRKNSKGINDIQTEFSVNISESDPPLWGKKQLRGVVSNATVNGGKTTPYSILRDMRRKSLKPFQERIVTGGRNFNYNIVDESVPSATANRIQLFPNVQSSLKSALALRFAKKDYMDKVNTLFGDTGASSNRVEENAVEKRKLLERLSEKFPVVHEAHSEFRSPRSSSQEEDGNTEGSETASSRGSDKTDTSAAAAADAIFKATSQAFNAFRDVEQKISISSRLGIRLPIEKEGLPSSSSINRVKADPFSHEFTTPEPFTPLSVQSENDLSIPSTSNLSVDSSTQIIPPVQQKMSTNFDSPELHNMVQKHLHMLRSKAEKKKKRKHVRKAPQEDNPMRSLPHFGQESQEPIFDFGIQDEEDYGIFALGDDDAYGYDLLNF
uniref:Uncharacterized protein n=1 Tax=Panagrolaimus sp. ES5 TaxID=591445 RepID=A0AC34FED2_9BILA